MWEGALSDDAPLRSREQTKPSSLKL
jgi:hypothetical protein